MRKQDSIEFLWDKFKPFLPANYTVDESVKILSILKQAKAMQQEQAQLYATFVLECVQNNLPIITFNDWINLENNEQQ